VRVRACERDDRRKKNEGKKRNQCGKSVRACVCAGMSVITEYVRMRFSQSYEYAV
jgi:hypothetical protein